MWIVTGASGFVGSHVLRELAPFEAVALTRRGSSPGARTADPWTVANLRAAFAGCRGIVHAASVVHRPETPPEEYARFNVEGTRSVIEAARAVGVEKLVFISSIKVHGEQPMATIDEATPVAPDADYARTKAEAERLVLAATDLRPTVLRLCPVFGRGDKGNVRTIIRAIDRRRFVIPGPGRVKKSLVHVSTVAQSVRAAVEKPAVGGVFVVADRTTPSIRELADVIAEELGRRRPPSLPYPLVHGLASVVGKVARLAGRATAISGTLVEKSVAPSECDSSKLSRELGLDPHVDLRWAVRDEIAWLRDLGELRRP